MSEKLLREILANQTEIMRALGSLLMARAHSEPDAEMARALDFDARRLDTAMSFTLEKLNGVKR